MSRGHQTDQRPKIFELHGLIAMELYSGAMLIVGGEAPKRQRSLATLLRFHPEVSERERQRRHILWKSFQFITSKKEKRNPVAAAAVVHKRQRWERERRGYFTYMDGAKGSFFSSSSALSSQERKKGVERRENFGQTLYVWKNYSCCWDVK